MELLPKGANFVRAKTLWEIGLQIAGNPATPYGGNRDMVITIGSGSGAVFRPWLRLATCHSRKFDPTGFARRRRIRASSDAMLQEGDRGAGASLGHDHAPHVG